MKIDIIYDPVCPWCFIGKRRLEQAIKERPNIPVTKGWRPFLLNPDMPTGGIDRTAYLIKKFGSETRVRRIYGAIAEAGQSVEIDFAFDAIEQTPNTVKAHKLVRFAGNLGRASEAVEALFYNYFINAKNIGETDILLGIAAPLGLPVDKLEQYLESDDDVSYIHQENAKAHRLGINGVPSYVFNGDMIISGAQEAPVLARLIDAAYAAEQAEAV